MKKFNPIFLLLIVLCLAGCSDDSTVSNNNNNNYEYYYSVKFNGNPTTIGEDGANYTGVGLNWGHGSAPDNKMTLHQGSCFSKVDINTMESTDLFGFVFYKTVRHDYDSLDIISVFNDRNPVYGNSYKLKDGVEIFFLDENDQLWTSSTRDSCPQNSDCYFKIDELTRKATTDNDKSIFKIKVSFKCTLYNGKGQSASLEGICRTRICCLN